MSSFQSQEYAINLMRLHDCRFWIIKDSDGRSVLGEQKDEESTLEQSIEALESALMEINGKYVNLHLRSKSRAQRGAGGDIKSGNFDLKVNLSGNQINGVNQGNSNNDLALKSLMQEIQSLKVQMIEQKHQQELGVLKQEISELKNGNPLLDQVIQGLAGVFVKGENNNQAAQIPALSQSPALSGTEPKKGTGRIQAAIKRLAVVDPNFIESLEKLVSFAENNPDQYHAYLSMLK
jgi:hypothetical protein